MIAVKKRSKLESEDELNSSETDEKKCYDPEDPKFRQDMTLKELLSSTFLGRQMPENSEQSRKDDEELIDEEEEIGDESSKGAGTVSGQKVIQFVNGKLILGSGQMAATPQKPLYSTSTRTRRERTKAKSWSKEETKWFFVCLSKCGTDFSMIEQLFKDYHRNRTEIKNKFKREQRLDPHRIAVILQNPAPLDLGEFRRRARSSEQSENATNSINNYNPIKKEDDDDNEEEEEEGEVAELTPSPQAQKPPVLRETLNPIVKVNLANEHEQEDDEEELIEED